MENLRVAVLDLHYWLASGSIGIDVHPQGDVVSMPLPPSVRMPQKHKYAHVNVWGACASLVRGFFMLWLVDVANPLGRGSTRLSDFSAY